MMDGMNGRMGGRTARLGRVSSMHGWEGGREGYEGQDHNANMIEHDEWVDDGQAMKDIYVFGGACAWGDGRAK